MRKLSLIIAAVLFLFLTILYFLASRNAIVVSTPFFVLETTTANMCVLSCLLGSAITIFLLISTGILFKSEPKKD